MQPSASSPSRAVDQFSTLHFAWWVGFLVLCFALWEFDKAGLALFFVLIMFLPPLLIAWLVGSVSNAVGRRWRRAASALLAPPLAGSLMMGLSFIGLDSQRVHFVLVKYPHEIEMHFSPSGANAFHSWSWGLDAAPLSPGIAYTLAYDPTDALLRAPKVPEKSIRPMGDHFYVVKESEDGSPL